MKLFEIFLDDIGLNIRDVDLDESEVIKISDYEYVHADAARGDLPLLIDNPRMRRNIVTPINWTMPRKEALEANRRRMANLYADTLVNSESWAEAVKRLREKQKEK